jgi:HAMP domain-containing protein
MGTFLCIITFFVMGVIVGAVVMFLVNRNNKKIIADLTNAVENGDFNIKTTKKIAAILRGETKNDCEDCY